MEKNRPQRSLFEEDEPENLPAQVIPVHSSISKQVIHGNVPSKSNCYRIVIIPNKDPKKAHAALAKTKLLKQYENDFFIQCNHYRNLNLEGYFEFEMDVFYPSQRSDLDNSMKVVLDCLQKVKAFANDNKCVKIIANKFLDKANPRIEFIIRPV